MQQNAEKSRLFRIPLQKSHSKCPLSGFLGEGGAAVEEEVAGGREAQGGAEEHEAEGVEEGEEAGSKGWDYAPSEADGEDVGAAEGRAVFFLSEDETRHVPAQLTARLHDAVEGVGEVEQDHVPRGGKE